MLIIFKTNSSNKSNNSWQSGKINFIFDGDSFRISDGQQIRLIGIDAPEKSQLLSEHSKSFLFLLIPPRSKINYEIIKIDKYDRILANVYNSDGLLVNEQLVKFGLAYVYYRYLSDLSPHIQSKLTSAEKYAKQNKLGIWKLDNQILPEQFRIENKQEIKKENVI